MDDMAKTKTFNKKDEEVKEEVKETPVVEETPVEEVPVVDTRPEEEKTEAEQQFGHTPEGVSGQVIIKETIQRNIQ